jgi:hypothetical protein
MIKQTRQSALSVRQHRSRPGGYVPELEHAFKFNDAVPLRHLTVSWKG